MSGNQTRARDADRSAACELIEAAYADGQLSLEEHDERVSQALAARTMGELRSLTRDLQGERLPAPPEPRKPLRARLALPRLRLPLRVKSWHVVVLVAIAGVSLGPLIVLTTRQGDMFSADALTEMVADAREELGSTRVDDISVFKKHAVLSRAQAGSPNREERWIYYRRPIGGGWDEWTKGTRDEGDAFVDLANVDMRAAIALMKRTPELTRVSDSDPEKWQLRIESTDGGRLYLFVSNEFHENGWVIAGLDGQIREVHPHDE